jgi:hypothetical protein
MAAKKDTVLSGKFERVGDVALDARKRVSLAKAVAALNGALVKKIAHEQERRFAGLALRNPYE